MTPTNPSLTEEMILNQHWMGKIKGWRRYRIEYGFEDDTPEGTIYLPPDINSDIFENFLKDLIKTSKKVIELSPIIEQ